MKKVKWLKYIGILLLFIFLFSYFIEYSGYYEYNLQNKKNLTELQIEMFENDIRNGKKIDIDSYLIDNEIDYSNSLTKTTSEVNLKLNEYLKKILTGGLDVLGKFIK